MSAAISNLSSGLYWEIYANILRVDRTWNSTEKCISPKACTVCVGLHLFWFVQHDCETVLHGYGRHHFLTILSRICGDSRPVFGLANGFIDHLYTQLGTTSNYSATANLHTLQITTAIAKPFPACCIFTSRSLTTASNSGDSSASRSQVLSSQAPVQNSTELIQSWSYFTICGCPPIISSWRQAPWDSRPEVSFFFQLRPCG
jgi:hypothetical protein